MTTLNGRPLSLSPIPSGRSKNLLNIGTWSSVSLCLPLREMPLTWELGCTCTVGTLNPAVHWESGLSINIYTKYIYFHFCICTYLFSSKQPTNILVILPMYPHWRMCQPVYIYISHPTSSSLQSVHCSTAYERLREVFQTFKKVVPNAKHCCIEPHQRHPPQMWIPLNVSYRKYTNVAESPPKTSLYCPFFITS